MQGASLSSVEDMEASPVFYAPLDFGFGGGLAVVTASPLVMASTCMWGSVTADGESVRHMGMPTTRPRSPWSGGLPGPVRASRDTAWCMHDSQDVVCRYVIFTSGWSILVDRGEQRAAPAGRGSAPAAD